MSAKQIIDAGLYAAAVELMDDEIREDLHRSGDYATDLEFLEAYMAAHKQKYGIDFIVN